MRERPGKPEKYSLAIWNISSNRVRSNFNAAINAIRRTNTKGVYDIHTNSMHYPATTQPTMAIFHQVVDEEAEAPKGSITFPPLSSVAARNLNVTDIYYETPPSGVAPAATEVGSMPDFLAPFRGLAAVSDDIKDLLPPDCREAFDAAVEKEITWKDKWGENAGKGCRREPIIDKGIVPYAMS
jgi:chromatin structure-remodeling complex protein RSC7